MNRELGGDPVMVAGSCLGTIVTGTFLALCSLLRPNGLLPGYNPIGIPDNPPMPGTLWGEPEVEFDEVQREIDSLRDQKPMRLKDADSMALHKWLYEALWHAFNEKKDEEALDKPRGGSIGVNAIDMMRRVFSQGECPHIVPSNTSPVA